MGSKVSVFIGSSMNGKPVVEKLLAWFTEHAGELAVTPWFDGTTFEPNRGILESLIRALRVHDFAILIATADDLANVRGQNIIQARDNVVFEFGLFMGKLGRARVFLAHADTMIGPSDLTGVITVSFKESDVIRGDPAAISELGNALANAIEKANDEDGGYFVLFPSLRNDPFYLDLLSGIASSSAETRDVTFLVPKEAYSGEQFLDRLDELASKQRGFKGGLIAPTLAGINSEEVRARIARFRIPIVIVDLNPFEDGNLPDKVYYVGVDNYEGGKLAARAVHAALAGAQAPRVLILANQDDQPKRHAGFIDGLGSGYETHVEFCAFSAQAGRDATIDAFRLYATTSRPFHAIFAVSDEIALGAVDALSALSGDPANRDVIVVGFDGIPAVRTLINLRISPLRNTVVQDAYRIGETAMSTLRRMVDGRLPAGTSRKQLVRLRLYLDPDSASARATGG